MKALKRVRIGKIRLTSNLRLGGVSEMTEKQKRNITRLAEAGKNRNRKAVEKTGTYETL